MYPSPVPVSPDQPESHGSSSSDTTEQLLRLALQFTWPRLTSIHCDDSDPHDHYHERGNVLARPSSFLVDIRLFNVSEFAWGVYIIVQRRAQTDSSQGSMYRENGTAA
jgi:hypothetical protein